MRHAVRLVSLAGSTIARCASSSAGALVLRPSSAAGGAARSAGCTRVMFVRHAEGLHNKASAEDPLFFEGANQSEQFVDSPLTPEGERQCGRLADELLEARPVGLGAELVVTSTLTRAMQTAALSFGRLPAPPPFLATELCRERVSLHTCDKRRRLSVLRAQFPAVDFSQVNPAHEEDVLWYQKEDLPHEHDSTACTERGTRFLRWLADRPEETIAVVSHWVFLRHLFRFQGVGDVRLGNAEIRSFDLCNSDAVATAG